MTQPRVRPPLPIYPPPQFPPRPDRAFARTPPLVFAPILGMLGLAQAMVRGLPRIEMSQAAGQLVFGLMTALWLFAVLAYLAKAIRRPAVVAEDLETLPGMAGLATATMGMMSIAGGLDAIAPGIGGAMLWPAMAAHLALVLLAGGVMMRQPAARRQISPVHHLLFGGFVVGAIAACRLNRLALAEAVMWAMIPVAVTLWAASLWQMRRALPPAPLRPLLAIHLAPAGLIANVAFQTGHVMIAQVFLGLAAAMLVVLTAWARWVMAAPFSPLWGLMIYPLAAVIGAIFVAGGIWLPLGVGLSVLAFGAGPALAWNVLKLWPGGRLAALTNAARS
ncbi:MAG: tellurium resistance protein [Paracoccaceae bacterium]